jgi:murein L,D-transpeptidase YafK
MSSNALLFLLKRASVKMAAFTIVFLMCSTAVQAGNIDHVVVKKGELLLYLMAGAKIVRTFDISLGDNPFGHKQREGDEKTPEGQYLLDYRNPDSRFYKSIHVSYPSAQDQHKATIGNHDPGGNIFIHGLPNGFDHIGGYFEGRNWTDGCIAVNDNNHMDEIWTLVKDGTPITILP